MNYNVAGVLRADGAFNLLAGLVLLFFYRPVVAFIGWPDTEISVTWRNAWLPHRARRDGMVTALEVAL